MRNDDERAESTRQVIINWRSVLVTESALDDLDLNDFGVSALEKSLESRSLSSVGVMLGILKTRTHETRSYT